ncbi:MBL fold metallo-hydrolase [Williamsia muralis]|uniref:MBL fold metallo-hydrolase n=1 Tax=Williamsia marianensis TaxID=85044 RepID=A0ABU4ERI7_WILMA|nr:MBL fold metallo-hydrolase [Williamsia muralis]MDV7133864.1 MBL fold metallo-hydrolase [Williamsia muralis]
MIGRNDDWYRGGVEAISSDTYRIPLPLPESGLAAINVYALVDDSGVVLIDSGADTSESRAALTAGLKTFGGTLQDIKQILVTHLHYDHLSQAIALREELNIPLALGIGEKEGVLDMVAAPVQMPQNLAVRLLSAGLGGEVTSLLDAGGPIEHGRWGSPDLWIEDAAQLSIGDQRNLLALRTPGHTRGHVVFHEPATGLLFAGDHLLPAITPSVGFEPVPARFPLRDYLASLDCTSEVADSRVMPAHGACGFASRQRVEEIQAHHRSRLEEIYQTVDGRTNVCALESARMLPWRSKRVPFDSLEGMDRLLAASETLAHLDVLVDQGRLTRRLIDNVWRFSAAA